MYEIYYFREEYVVNNAPLSKPAKDHYPRNSGLQKRPIVIYVVHFNICNEKYILEIQK